MMIMMMMLTGLACDEFHGIDPWLNERNKQMQIDAIYTHWHMCVSVLHLNAPQYRLVEQIYPSNS